MSIVIERTDALAVAREVLQIEIEALQRVLEALDARFERAVEVLLRCQGRVVLSGVGKSGAIARKLAGTFSSTGTPAIFLHPTEAAHGDLGTITEQDVAILLSFRGESDELVLLCPALKRLRVYTIVMTGRPDSTLGRMADLVLEVPVEREACPHNLAPTASTTAMLALGDALAMATMAARGFTPRDFALNHPAGALGRRLLLRAHDVMRTGDSLAIVPENAPLRDALFAITKAGAGAACVVNEAGVMVGIVTDGDIRRRLLQDETALSRPVSEAMTRNPMVITGNPLAIEVLECFNSAPRKIGDLPVLDEQGKPIGMVVLKDLLRSGIV
ncbi:MAG: KpsF/GutQ family sugar-phosphate isomerase [Fimbriimonadales bacterium]|nr:KpsF/GutQ family sugar-phosphate isomerase [Fimbriimonadales bacterium]MDW8051155.1 KpsF/GutQ family sugar-phosphate isomerase [Armatimonadota bacterium]